MPALFIAIVFLIIYGSLYPWHFVHVRLPASPLWILLHSWGDPKDRRFLGDLIINIALYMPLGAAGFLSFRRFRIAGPILFGTLLSACIEMLQLFTRTRICSSFDLTMNIAGSAAGVGWALWFEKVAGPHHWHLGLPRGRDRAALALLFCWVGWVVFPLYPETHLPMLRADLAAFTRAPVFAFLPFVSALGAWYVAGRLLAAAGIQEARAWLAVSLLLLPGQFLIITRQPTPAGMLGALAGFLLFVVAPEAPLRGVAAMFVALLAMRGLMPFHWTTEAHAFHWLPFQGFMTREDTGGATLLFEKTFFYGSALWLLRTAEMKRGRATLLVVTLLAALEAAQTHLPGRTPEITDPLLALLISGGMRAVSPRPRSGAELLPPVPR